VSQAPAGEICNLMAAVVPVTFSLILYGILLTIVGNKKTLKMGDQFIKE
jgi:hypothetical protein